MHNVFPFVYNCNVFVSHVCSYACLLVNRVQTMEGEAKSSGEEAGAWFSTFMKMEGLQLFHMTEEERPRILLEDESWKDYCESGQEVSFVRVKV